ncbi:MAG: DPP IV N-terminal domain-containing protein, partial [Deltaproteobacteria bacterium]|nr:DPP IV N-terminal domain-containing protein [Deltaproteobacteria bacterium]
MSGLAPTDNALSAADAKFLETLSQTKSFTLGRPTGVQMTRDGKTAVFLRALPRKAEQRLFAFELASGQTRELASNESVLGAGDEQLSPEEKARRERMRITARGIVQFELSEDGTLALFQLGGRAWVVPVAGGKAKEAAGPDAASHPIFDPHLSPDASMVSFVRGGELWVASLAGPMQKQLTSGSSTTLLHARAEYVAQEELSRFQGYWWSPDSKSLVYEEVDNSGVEQLWLQDPGAMFNAVTPMAYPRPGKANAKIRFGIVPAAGGETRWIDHDAKQWEYVSRVTWQPGGPLAMIVLTRDQKTLGLLAVDPNTGAARELLREHDDVFLNSERDLRFLADGRFLWSSEAEGRWQLHLHAADGKRERTLTPLELGFVHIAGLDEADGVVFVTASPTPVQGQLHEVKLDGSGVTRLHAGDEHVTASFSRTRARVEHVLPAEGEPKSIAVRADGTIAGELPSVAEAPPFMPKLTVRVVGGMASSELAARDTTKSMLEFYTALIKPHDFDASKKYPTLVRVYGGPHRNEVHETAFNYLIDQWIADHGFLVLHVD